MTFTNRLITDTIVTDKNAIKTELKTTPPEVAMKLKEYETFWINGVKVVYDVEHTFNLAIHKDIAESKYKHLIERGLLHFWNEEDEEHLWEGFEDWADEDDLKVLEASRQHYWHWSSLIHPADENDNPMYGEMEDEEHFKWLGIDENDTNEDLNDIGNG